METITAGHGRWAAAEGASARKRGAYAALDHGADLLLLVLRFSPRGLIPSANSAAPMAGQAPPAAAAIGAARIGDQADPGEGLQEAGAFGGDHHVAGQREVRPCPAAVPFTAAMVGTGNRRSPQHRDVFVAQRAFEVEVVGIGPVAQVLPRTEGLALPRSAPRPAPRSPAVPSPHG
jgi:hypothetical protein